MSTAIHGGNCTWTGSIVLNGLTVDGNPNFSFDNDCMCQIVSSDWQTSNFTPISPSAFSLAIS